MNLVSLVPSLLTRLCGPGAPSTSALLIAYAVNLPLALYALWHYAIKVVVRIGEPGPIGWMEPQFLRSALEAAAGRFLYPAPTLHYIGTIYTPGADYLNAAVIGMFGVEYPPLRIAAFSLFVGVLVVLSIWIYRATRDPFWAAIGVILQLSLCTPVDNWFTRLNIDAHYLLFGSIGIALLFFGARHRQAVIVAAVCLGLAFICKPQGFFWAVAGFIGLFAHDRRRALEYALVCGGLSALVAFALLIGSDGWFWRSVITVALETPDKVRIRWAASLLSFSWLSSAALVAVLPLVAVAAWRRRNSQMTLLLVWTLAVLLQSYTSFARLGGGPKHLHVIALVGMLLLGLLPKVLAELGLGVVPIRFVKTGVLGLAALVIFTGFGRSHHAARLVDRHGGIVAARGALFHNYRAFNDRVTRAVQSYPGTVLVGGRVLPQAQLGKPLHTHQTPLQHYTMVADLTSWGAIVGGSIAAHDYDALILWKWWWPCPDMWADVERHYLLKQKLGLDPLIGMEVSLWERRER